PRFELRPLNKIVEELLLISLELSLGAGRAKHVVLLQLLDFAHELTITRHFARDYVGEIGEHASVLKLNRKEKSRRDIDSLDLDALRIVAAGSDVTDPKVKARRVRLAVKKIKILVPHKKLRVITGVGWGSRRVAFVVLNCESGISWAHQISACAGRIA